MAFSEVIGGGKKVEQRYGMLIANATFDIVFRVHSFICIYLLEGKQDNNDQGEG